ncbi:uncharacterized protein LOC115739762 isoform X2 [Rhodamnia argentea]|uniref:Uncharacterized protein LOC115739762 isoform X2 n=1 Tax=Rhodamnia argentea TaxID=178133 RepID=A0ABM3HXI6_9MYRT|nr:uncharacterized protein LOC115739762 isoform X2 [Rhodamnia argentea]
MEETPWEQKLQALTHLLTSPTTNPSLHSQFLVASLVPCYLRWDYPPLLCSQAGPNSDPDDLLLLRWSLSLFLRRLPRLGLPETSWRCKCPYQQPPPAVLAAGVEEARWGDAERREYFRRRLRRRRLGRDVNPLVPILVPNLLLFSLLLWDPFPESRDLHG